MGKGRKKKIPQKQNQQALDNDVSNGESESASENGSPVEAKLSNGSVPPQQKQQPQQQQQPQTLQQPQQQQQPQTLQQPACQVVNQPQPEQHKPLMAQSADVTKAMRQLDLSSLAQQQPTAPISPKRRGSGNNSPKSPLRKETMMTSSIGFTKQELQPPKCQREEKVGKAGKLIKIEVNFLPMKINIPGGTVYHYDVDFKFPWKREIRKSDRPFLIQVVEHFKKQHKAVLGNPYSIVFDGLKNIYTCRCLDFPSGDYEGKVEIVKDEDTQEKIEMIVKIKIVGAVEINHALEEYIRSGTSATRPADAMQVLNIVLGMTPQLHYVSVGRNYFNHDHKDCVVDLGGAKSLWVGTFKSVRMGWLPMLNVDMANKPAYERCNVIDFVQKFIQRSSRPGRPPKPGPPLSDRRDFAMVDHELKGLKIRYNRPDGGKRDYRVNKLMDPATHLKMKLEDGSVITIQKYFRDSYKTELKHPSLPCLHLGDPGKTIYIPMEFCEIKQQLAPLSKKLSDVEGAKMIKETAVPPKERTQRIRENMRAMNHYYQKDPYAKEFGIRVEDKWLQINARVLDPPILKYQVCQNGKKEVEVPFKKVYGGKWNMGALRDPEKYRFVKGSSLQIWGLLDLARMQGDRLEVFVNALYNEGACRGLNIEWPEYDKADVRNPQDIENKFLNLRKKILEKHKKEPQLIMLICPEKGTFRNSIKYLGDAVLNIPTQFVMRNNVEGKGNSGPNPQTVHNICLKLNSKIGGINQALHNSVRPEILKVPVMIMGGDVTHPSPSDMSRKPSIAAVVGSCDPNASKYNTEVRLQNSGQVVEVIENMEDMAYNLLEKFQIQTGIWPKKILYYRDGVSEGQFIDVLNSELTAIRKACVRIGKKAGQSYEPQVTFIVAQKRHKTFPNPVNERDGVGDTKNVPPGTVIDTVICHPTEKDFYLASQLAIKGTVKPAHYHVLWDENRMKPDEIQRLTYDLCHLYSRCERSVSYPAPTYYSHLAAFRAREHHNALIDKTPKRRAEEVALADIRKMESLDIFNYFI